VIEEVTMSNHIRAGLPIYPAQHDDGLPPREQPGAARRGYSPHRAGSLCQLAKRSLSLAPLTFCLPPLVFLNLLALTTAALANRDLKRMARGTLDPSGYAETQQARSRARDAVILYAIAGLQWVLLGSFALVYGHWPW
jgi:hypothetical protein